MVILEGETAEPTSVPTSIPIEELFDHGFWDNDGGDHHTDFVNDDYGSDHHTDFVNDNQHPAAPRGSIKPVVEVFYSNYRWDHFLWTR